MNGSWRRSSRCEAGFCLEVAGPFRKSTHSSDTWNCVEARRPLAGVVLVRDSKLGDDSPVLEWTVGEWTAFLSLIVTGVTPPIVTVLPSGGVELRGAWRRGGPLTFTEGEWAAFVLGVRDGEFDVEEVVGS